MLLITFVGSAIDCDQLDNLREAGKHIFEPNRVGSKYVLRNEEKKLEINIGVYTSDKHWETKVEIYEQLIKTFDSSYQE